MTGQKGLGSPESEYVNTKEEYRSEYKYKYKYESKCKCKYKYKISIQTMYQR